MSYRVRRHPLVAHDLETITNLIADDAGPQAALRKLEEIERTLRGLSRVPHRGTTRDEMTPGLRVRRQPIEETPLTTAATGGRQSPVSA
ncbi:MAG: type II toxin-antitoxin system RelE/ParE family toxin [Geminicoccaceae bacterium]|nr:MAG: type II toxin-antitoxin system RelE/ParE family toxin [Geminicoccaceae bacterium]